MPNTKKPPLTLRILVVDDDRVSRIRLCGLLRQFGHTPIEADCGEAAIDCFTREEIDAVLLDIIMPGMNGFETATHLKALSQDRWVPVVFLSALNERNERSNWLMIGDDFLHKPVDLQLLQARLFSLSQAIYQERLAQRALQRMEEEERLAAQLMERISQQGQQHFPGIDIRTTSAAISSGDCVLLEGSPERYYLLIADAMGHGLAAAVTLMPAVTIFRTMARKDLAPDQIMREMNLKLREQLPRGHFISAQIIRIDRQTRSLEICSSGMPAMLLLDEAGQVRASLRASCPPLGVVDTGRFLACTETLNWHEGETLLTGTDGFCESFGDDPEALFRAAPSYFAQDTATPFGDKLWQAWCAAPTQDDASMVVIQFA